MKSSNATLNVRELAEYLGIGINSAYQLVRQSDFPALRIGKKRIIVPIEALNNWLINNAEKQIV